MANKRGTRRAERRLAIKASAYNNMVSANKVNGAAAFTKPGSMKRD